MTTRREWLRQQRRRKYGKYRGLFLAGGILAALVTAGLLLFCFLRFILPGIRKGKEEEEAKEYP